MATVARTLGIVAAALLAGGASAQATGEKVWGSVVIVYHGEQQPFQLFDDPALTPLGAEQLYAQGQVFRARYLLPNVSFPPELVDVTSKANIQGLERQAIDNNQISILTTSDSYMGPSALAFLQGLYPPVNQSVSRGAGGMDSAELADGSLLNFPLNGYQYPRIQTLAPSDPESTWIQGHATCTQWVNQAIQMRGEADLKQIDRDSAALYQTVWNKLGAPTPYSPDTVNFFSAYRIFDLARYNYTHGNATRSGLTELEMVQLEALATRQQMSLNGNLTAYGKTPNDMIRAISGRMMAGKVASSMRAMLHSNGENKLTLIFGSHEPFLAFFALSGLVGSPSKDVFQQLPGQGAVMAFEAFTAGDYANSSSGPLPSESDLWVRFVYRNGTDPGASVIEYPLFHNGNSQRLMRFTDFLRAMDGIGVSSVSEWCRLCGSTELYCPIYDRNGNPVDIGNIMSGGGGGFSSAAAGVIGVISAFTFLSVVLAAAMLCCGIRFTRNQRGDDPGRRSSGGSGGFKGPEKRQDDPDVAYGRGGVRHERTGSWELRGGGDGSSSTPTNTPAVPAPTAIAGRGTGRDTVGASISRIRSEGEDDAMRKDAMLDDDDTARLFHATPVQPRSSL